MASSHNASDESTPLNNDTSHSTTATNYDDNDRVSSACVKYVSDFYKQNVFVLLVILAILLAQIYPPLGAVYLVPHITATWLAVVFIFLLAGLGLKTEEFTKAFQQLCYNTTIQLYNFGFVSLLVYTASRALLYVRVIPLSLANGMVMGACVPLTINAALVMAKASGGDEAAAIFNSAFGNLLGVVVSPLLILGYLGVTAQVDLSKTLYKLLLRVVVPIVIGQILQKTSPFVVDWVAAHKQTLKQCQTYALVFIVYTVFCKTFSSSTTHVVNLSDIILMILFQVILLLAVMAIAWYIVLPIVLPSGSNSGSLRVTGLFACSHKSVAMGVPLIGAIYPNDPLVGLYTLPLLIWHPMQLVIGSLLAPRLQAFVIESSSFPLEDDLLLTVTTNGVEEALGIQSEQSTLDRRTSESSNIHAARRRSSVHDSIGDEF